MNPENESVPPIAKIKPYKFEIHGDEIIDNYFWLRDDSRKNPEVISYLEAENEYTKSMMKHTEDKQETLYQEMKSRIKEDDESAPEKSGKYIYFSRTIKEKQYRTYHRKLENGTEELLLDGNALVEGHEYFKLGVFKISPDHRYLAYSIDNNGSEQYVLYIKDLTSNQLLPEKIVNTYYNAEWSNDSTQLYYTTLSEIKQPNKAFRHILRTDPINDKLLYEEKDEKFDLTIRKTHDCHYIILKLKSTISSEIYYLDVNLLDDDFHIIHKREDDLEYYIEHWNNQFFIRTNLDNATNFKLMVTSVKTPSIGNWKEVIPHRESIMLNGIDVFEKHLILWEREDGLAKIRIIDQNTQQDHIVDFPEPSYTLFFPEEESPLDYPEPSLIHPEYKTNKKRILYSSLVSPYSVFDYDMDKKILDLVKRKDVLGDFKQDNFKTERIKAVASDGTGVYISLVYKKGTMLKDGTNKLLLTGYGAYGSTHMDSEFDSNLLSLLNRKVIYAIAHIRGGGEMGRKWYDDGKLLQKKNTFTDFITCIEYLIKEKYTSSENLAITGGSAGGLLMGAVINMRPELFKLMITRVPFVDVINTMLDPTIPLTVLEYQEWGNPENKEYYDYMKSYSPYDNVEAKDYPHILVTAGLNDPRVQYWEPAKWVAKLRAIKTDNNKLLLKTDMGSGHGGKSGRYDYLKEIAFRYMFLIDIFGLTI